MKKYIIMAFTVMGLTTAVFGIKYNQNDADKCFCNQTEICTCFDDCDCSSCES